MTGKSSKRQSTSPRRSSTDQSPTLRGDFGLPFSLLRAQVKTVLHLQRTGRFPLLTALAPLLGRAGAKDSQGSPFFGWGLGSAPPWHPCGSACLIDKGKKNRNGRTYLQTHRRLGGGVNENPPPHLPCGRSSTAPARLARSTTVLHCEGRWAMGCGTIFAPSLTVELQAQRFFLAASARSLLCARTGAAQIYQKDV
jgi:hypothetical protein